jgi:hypothetical protein
MAVNLTPGKDDNKKDKLKIQSGESNVVLLIRC